MQVSVCQAGAGCRAAGSSRCRAHRCGKPPGGDPSGCTQRGFRRTCNGRIVEMGHGLQAEGIISVAGGAYAQLGKRQAAVGVEQIRLIFIDEFLHNGQPVFAELLVLRIPLVQIHGSFVVDVLRSVVVIKITVGRIVAVIRHTGIGHSCRGSCSHTTRRTTRRGAP